MLRNFVLITFRNLFRHKLYSFINIAGLSVGLSCTLLILLWVYDEVSYDHFHPNIDNLQQVWVNAEFDGDVNSWNSVPLPTYEAMKTADSNIKNSCVSGWGGDRLLTVGEVKLKQHGYYVSDEFLEMFQFDLEYGDAKTALEEPRSIVITRGLADKLFPGQNAIGESVVVEDRDPLKVTAILKDLPSNSSFDFEYLIPWKYRESISPWIVENKTNWGNYSFQVYIELFDAKRQEETQANIAGLLEEKGEDDIPRWFFLHPMEKWRLYSQFDDGKIAGGMIEYVKLFAGIAVFILVIACINFMNLSTARSERRAREVGIRKSMGSNKKQLIFQFLGESLLISFLSFVVAVLLSIIVLPWYNGLVEKDLSIDFTSPVFWILGFSVVLISGLLSGSYPAFYLSSFSPVRTLKGKIKTGKSGSIARKVLVVIQFSFSILMMVGTIIVLQQIKMVQSRDLGYNQENLIMLDLNEGLDDKYDLVKNELLATGKVLGVTRSNGRITNVNSNNFLGWPGKPESLRVLFVTVATEYDYTETMGIEILQGRDFSHEFASDSDAVIINKAALDLMNLEDPIGTQLDLWEGNRKLIGVVDNALMGSPYEEIRPLFMILDREWASTVTVRLKATNDLSASLEEVGSVFEKHNPAYPFEYKFADVEFQRKFTTIALTQKLATVFAFLTLFITGLGLFGLSAFTAEQRTKEIGIRKVLGASVFQLIRLMNIEFIRLVLLSLFITIPVSWYLMDQYLDRYNVRIDIQWWVFLLVGAVSTIFALAVVSNQARKAAVANPAYSLRSE